MSFEPGMKEQRSDESENDEAMCAKWVYMNEADYCYVLLWSLLLVFDATVHRTRALICH